MDRRPFEATNKQGFFKLVAMIHAALLIGQVLFAIVVFSITKSTGLNLKPTPDDLFFYIALVLVIAGIFGGSFAYKQQLTKLPDTATLREKLTGYQTALIIRCALSQGACFFCIVCYMLTGNEFYLVLTGINILYFIWVRPVKDQIADDLNLSYENKEELGWAM
jgi:hypothetical protein